MTVTMFSAQHTGPKDPAKLSLEELYPVVPFRGKTAQKMSFSYDEQYLAFLWNEYYQPGTDLYIYDLNGKTLKKVTSIDRMKEFDPPEEHENFLAKWKQKKQENDITQQMYFAQRDYLMGKDVDLDRFEREELEALKLELKKEREKKQAEEAKKSKNKKKKKKKKKSKKEKTEELELWELRDKLKEKKKKEKIKRTDLYPGVKAYVWSKTKPELIFQYRGDLFRYIPATDQIIRLTMTDRKEEILAYTPDSDGYFYAKDNQAFKVMFASSYIQQLNHKLDKKNKYKIDGTSISPNGQWMMILAKKQEGKSGYRDVQIMSYKERFAKATKVKRQVADDKRNEPHYRLILRKIQNTNFGREPEHIFDIPGGDNWYEFSNIKWNKKGSMYAFITWEREKGDLKIWTGETAEGKKPEMLFAMKEKIGFKSFYHRNLKFSPDGKYLAAIINNGKGFRQPVLFDLATKKKLTLTDGRFEAYPILGFSKDSAKMYVESDKLSPAKHSIFEITLATKEMKLVGNENGMHSGSKISKSNRWIATNFGNWEKRPELHIMDLEKSVTKVVTASHRKDWDQFNFIKPERFTYQNRQGQTIHGMIFKPKGWSPEDKRPGIVYMYGGPLNTDHTVESDNYSTLAYLFQMIMAAKHGYVTVNIDPRGQSGYGRDFSEANFEQVGIPQTQDLEDLVKHMGKDFGVDTKRLGLHGWSFGGFQTLMTMFTSPDTFRCGIAAASVTEWENYNSWYAGSTIGPSVRKKPTLRKYSLLPLAKKLKHPLLLVHGMMDPNVLYQDTVKVYQALLEAGKETLVDLFLDPEGKHGLNGIVKNKSTYKKFESWFVSQLGEYRE